MVAATKRRFIHSHWDKPNVSSFRVSADEIASVVGAVSPRDELIHLYNRRNRGMDVV